LFNDPALRPPVLQPFAIYFSISIYSLLGGRRG